MTGSVDLNPNHPAIVEHILADYGQPRFHQVPGTAY